jgi:tRNA (mo5U34)-methyltransferase
MSPAELSHDPASVTLWYHTIDLPGGITTPGWFDLRPTVDRLPWPDVSGKRCLDVGTYDGFLAFEMERRGAREVVATDIENHEDWDWPAAARARGGAGLALLAGKKGHGFEVAKAALGSNVEKRLISAYHLTPEEMGKFDVVVCGSLMLHLRDPIRALEAIRSVCDGWFMSIEEISLPLTLLARGRPVAEVRHSPDACQWSVPNMAAHRRMVEASGFEVTRTFGPFAERFGRGHRAGSLLTRLRHRPLLPLLRRVALGDDGNPHAALLARPCLDAPPIRL